MLKLEEIVRLSKAYVNKCSEVKDEVNGWLRVTGEVQELVASRFGFKDQISNMFAVNLMRSAHTNYRDDPRFSEVSVYVRNNLAEKGNLSIGAEIPNVIINNLHGEDISLSTIIGDKDTVVISSSATWQPFRAIIQMLSDYTQTIYKDLNIIFIYISEAHATDVWPIGLSAGVLNKKHKTINDRIQCAKNMIDEHEFKVPVYLDNMENSYRDTYSSWPFRIYGFKQHKIDYISDIEDAQFNISELFDYLK